MHGLGQAMGTAAGGMAWEWVGFENGMLVESVIIFGSIILVIVIRNCSSSKSATIDNEKIELINKK